MPAVWSFVSAFPTSEQLVRAGRRRWDKFLAKHGLKRPETYEKRLEIFARASEFRGTAPVSFSSGQMHVVRLRRACKKHLRAAVHLWANLSRPLCAWAEAYYQQKRAQKMSHARALRCLGQRWLKILWKLWQTRTKYDEALHTRNQTQHGSWVIALLPSAAQP